MSLDDAFLSLSDPDYFDNDNGDTFDSSEQKDSNPIYSSNSNDFSSLNEPGTTKYTFVTTERSVSPYTSSISLGSPGRTNGYNSAETFDMPKFTPAQFTPSQASSSVVSSYQNDPSPSNQNTLNSSPVSNSYQNVPTSQTNINSRPVGNSYQNVQSSSPKQNSFNAPVSYVGTSFPTSPYGHGQGSTTSNQGNNQFSGASVSNTYTVIQEYKKKLFRGYLR